MEQLLVPLLIAVIVFLAALTIIRRLDSNQAATKHQQKVLGQIYQQKEEGGFGQTEKSILRQEAQGAGRFILSLPKGDAIYSMLLRAGMEDRAIVVIILAIGVFFLVTIGLSGSLGPAIATLVGLAAGYFVPKKYLNRKITKRNEAFINQFPDAVDMIVRSVRSGHPLNTALKMVAENMDPPISTEFKNLVDEIAFGRTNTEALRRLSYRVDEPDLHFFVVILSVQQETGGNLAEVLSNLSGIIRKRKQLRLKIKAMTSEGRATAYILGSLPLVVFGAIHITSPDYLTPLFTTTGGNIILGTAVGLVALAAFIIKNMLNIDI